MVPRHELDARILSLQQVLREKDIDAALIVQHADLYYFGGVVNQAWLYVPALGEATLFAFPGAERVRNETKCSRIVQIANPGCLPRKLREFGFHNPGILGLEADVLPALFYNRLSRLFPSSRLVDISGMIRRIRMVKSAWELGKMRAACKMGLKVFEFVPQVLREAIREIDLVGYIEQYSRQLGHPGYRRVRTFNQELTCSTVLSGPDAGLPSYSGGSLGGKGLDSAFPHASTKRLIEKNEPVIVNFSAWGEGYVADMTRTYCIGALPSHMDHAYETALTIQERLKKIAKTGEPCCEVWRDIERLVRKQGLSEHFLGMSRHASCIGHGVGLEIDELPTLSLQSDMVLQTNMVVTVEPIFVFPDGAIGLANTFVVGNNGLTSFLDGNDAVVVVQEH